jgi:enoyl-CoA hydratase/carnithine racemase
MNDPAVSNILSEVRERVLILRMHRPEKKNALTQAMYQALGDEIRKADADADVRALVIAGSSELFTSGNDIKDFLAAAAANGGDIERHPTAHFMRALYEFRKPALAAVNGLAIGIGTTMLLHCDLAYAGESAKFQMPFVNIGIVPEFCSTFLLPAMLGHRRTAELLYTGETFDANKALACGLINAVVPDAQCFDYAFAMAQKLAAQPPQSLRVCKKLLRDSLDAPMREAFKREIDALGTQLKGPEALEALNAFMQKRKPDFSRFS